MYYFQFYLKLINNLILNIAHILSIFFIYDSYFNVTNIENYMGEAGAE